METTLTIVTDDATTTCSMADFLRDNEDDAEMCARVRNMDAGTWLEEGGGACPWVRIIKEA